MRVFGCFLVVCLLPTAQVAGRDIHVNNLSGDDGSTGRNLQNTADRGGPVRTISKALRLARGGDRIVLAKTKQPYREGISLVGSRHSGFLDRPFVIEGNGAILDGSAPVGPDAWEHYRGAVFRFRPPRTGHQQLFIDDRPAARVAVDRPAQQPPELEPLQWCLYGGQILFRVEPGKLPGEYNSSFAYRQTGITLFHVRGVAILNLTVQGFRLDGINAQNSAREVYISDVTSRGNGRAGIAVGGASKVELDVCVVGNNNLAQLLTLPYSRTSVRSSQLFSSTAPAWVDRGGRVWINGRRVEGGVDRVDIEPAGDAEN